jgi:hypothetical protein
MGPGSALALLACPGRRIYFPIEPINVIASEAKQSSFGKAKKEWIASLRSQ